MCVVLRALRWPRRLSPIHRPLPLVFGLPASAKDDCLTERTPDSPTVVKQLEQHVPCVRGSPVASRGSEL